jgi:cytochrome c-type biogenesis protein CcmH
MMLWLVMALMTAAAVLAVLWPLSRRVSLIAGSDVAVYRDQLGEIERDRAAGLIGAREAEAARIEVSRRLIAAADAAVPGPAAGSPWRRRVTAVIALVFLPLGAAGLYLALGSPGVPGQPQAARRDMLPEQRSITELVARVEAHLEQNAEDGRGWEVLGPVYMRLGRFDDAVKARRNALRLLGPSAEREADLGEALTAAANGVVTADARQAFERALALNAGDFRARYFLGLAAEQDGHPGEAAEMWRRLLASAPADAPWTAFVREQLERVDPNAAAPSSPTARAPSTEEVAAASELSPEQRLAMARGMVERLAERLRQDGTDVEGWVRLVRSYIVLGETDKARRAASEARRALANEPEKLRRMDETIKALGLEG